jgi:adenylate cyclase
MPVDPASPIVLVDINESSLRALEPVVGRWPWPRLVHASAIDYLTRAGAKVIAYDVLFGEHEGRVESIVNGQRVTGDESDRALVDSVRRAGNVILLADAVFEGMAGPAAAPAGPPPVLPGTRYVPGPGFQARPTIALPFAELSAVAFGVGHNVLAKDSSGEARRMLPFIETPAGAVPSLGMAAALAYRGVASGDVALEGQRLRIGGARVPLLADPAPIPAGGTEPSRQLLLRFHEAVKDSDNVATAFPRYPFFNVLLSEDQVLGGKAPAIPPSAFAGKIVFVGVSADALHDQFPTPVTARSGNGAGSPGIELHATLADNVLSSLFMVRTPFWHDAAVTGGVALASALAATLLPVAWGTGLVVAGLTSLALWFTRAVGGGVWAGLVMPMSAGAFSLFGGVAWQYVIEGREKRHVRQLFGRYVSRDVIDQLMADPARAALGGQKREMTVLFSDIRNFTTASEHAAPEAVVAQLNEYFAAMVDVLFRHRGTLDKFVGDMVMGLFGAPLDDPDHADHAVAAALEMLEVLAGLNARWTAAGRPALDIGIGINSGEMIAGNIGSEAIMSYTVIGDAVNTGSRLESLNKQYGTHILISDATRARLKRVVNTRPIGEVTVKGRAQAVTVYEVRP